jgi:hypothetical protein
VVEGKTGLIVRDATAEGWAAALDELMRDPARRSAMGREARAWSLVHAPTWRDVLVEDLLPAWHAAARRRDALGAA